MCTSACNVLTPQGKIVVASITFVVGTWLDVGTSVGFSILLGPFAPEEYSYAVRIDSQHGILPITHRTAAMWHAHVSALGMLA